MSRRKNWPVLIAEWEKSGLTITKFCQEKGVNYTNFFKWRKQLELEKTDSESFVPVKFSSEKKHISLSIRIGDNLRIEAEDNFETGQLIRVIEALDNI